MSTPTTTKTFTLAQMLSITTGRLCSDIDDVYKVLSHVTGDVIFTHTIPRAMRFAVPIILKDHPDLALANACFSNLDKWVAVDRTARKTECTKMWIAELKMMFPTLNKSFDVKSYSDAWLSLDPVSELEGMTGKNKTIVQ